MERICWVAVGVIILKMATEEIRILSVEVSSILKSTSAILFLKYTNQPRRTKRYLIANIGGRIRFAPKDTVTTCLTQQKRKKYQTRCEVGTKLSTQSVSDEEDRCTPTYICSAITNHPQEYSMQALPSCKDIIRWMQRRWQDKLIE